MKQYLQWLGTIASVTALILQALGIPGSFGGPAVLVLVAVAILSLALGWERDVRRFRFLVLRSCLKIKRHAQSTLDIAAGDCSWLQGELDILMERAQEGVRIRLLCQPTGNSACRGAIDRVKALQNVEVRVYPDDFDTYLRCIIADAERLPNQAILLLDKRVSSRSFFGIIRWPKQLNRDHNVTFISPQSRLFGLIRVVFDRTFKAGKEWPVAVVPSQTITASSAKENK